MDIDVKRLEDVLRQLAQTRSACEAKGHPGEEITRYSTYRGVYNASAYCKDCGAVYSRGMNPKELKDFLELMRRPMTI